MTEGEQKGVKLMRIMRLSMKTIDTPFFEGVAGGEEANRPSYLHANNIKNETFGDRVAC